MEKDLIKSTNSELVEQIHYEFDVAGDNDLAEAKAILATDKSEEMEAKSKRLQALGFGSSKDVKKTSEYLTDRHQASIDVELIAYYKEAYPLNKFINEKSIEKICEKYGIVKGKVEWFTGEVPEKNIQEIENFKVKDKDSLWDKPSSWSSRIGSMLAPTIIPGELVSYDEHYSHEMGLDSQIRSNAQEVQMEMDRMRGFANPSLISVMVDNGMVDNGMVPTSDSMSNQFGNHPSSYQKAPLQIVAPIADFDSEKFDLEKTGYDLTQKVADAPKFDFNWLLNDPIVLQPVKRGYLIVSAWGLEAADPDVMNELMN